jgi:hypothetical protein
MSERERSSVARIDALARELSLERAPRRFSR